MNKEIVDNIMYKVNQLMQNEDFSDAKIEYVLINTKDVKNSIALIKDKDQELYEVILKDNVIKVALDWVYNIDEDIFEYLENEFEIGFMDFEFHYGIWNQIEDIGIEEFEHKLGLQKYLKFCKENSISKENIYKELNIDIKDIMHYYDKRTDYVKIENKEVKIPQNVYIKETEINYISFYLGYDLLNVELSQSKLNECDKVYDFCNYLSKKFIETEYYKNKWKSTYDNLKEWLEEDIDIIKSELLYYLGEENKTILEIGKRNNTKVALVEKDTKYGKEYIIAFGYRIDDKKLEWSYGYYYDKNLEKAREDLENVKAGKTILQEELGIPKTVEEYKEIKEKIEKKLMSDSDYIDYKIECILIDKKNITKSYGIAMNYNDVAIVDLEDNEITNIQNAEWSYDIGDNIFFALQVEKKDISYMSMATHYYIWKEIENNYPEYVIYKKGMQMYLKYCKENHITKEAIERETNYNDTPDLIEYLKEKKISDKNRWIR